MDSKFDEYLKKFNKYLDDIDSKQQRIAQPMEHVQPTISETKPVVSPPLEETQNVTYHQGNRTELYRQEIRELEEKIKSQQEKLDKMIDLSKAILIMNNKLTTKLEKYQTTNHHLLRENGKYKHVIKQINKMSDVDES